LFGASKYALNCGNLLQQQTKLTTVLNQIDHCCDSRGHSQ